MSESVTGISHEDIKITCKKNSRGPTGRHTKVRKSSQRREDGSTVFWWDWELSSGEFLAELTKTNPIKEVCSVEKTGSEYNCKALGLKAASLQDIGKAVHSVENAAVLEEILKAGRIYRLKEFNRISPEEYAKALEMAEAHRTEYVASLAEKE
jgi:hypothetical protein